mmetsp:Transcript_15842/g.37040  ORF Transcript_15842/g.37040 Transcript_15842/m.37040 type:complete len:219 (+) Transcript_15842:790-1446(+)
MIPVCDGHKLLELLARQLYRRRVPEELGQPREDSVEVPPVLEEALQLEQLTTVGLLYGRDCTLCPLPSSDDLHRPIITREARLRRLADEEVPPSWLGNHRPLLESALHKALLRKEVGVSEVLPEVRGDRVPVCRAAVHRFRELGHRDADPAQECRGRIRQLSYRQERRKLKELVAKAGLRQHVDRDCAELGPLCIPLGSIRAQGLTAPVLPPKFRRRG